jgi:PPK2 family polyphosphate:nucleotide phosphotransferase
MDTAKLFCVKPGSAVNLKRWDPWDTGGFASKEASGEELAANVQELAHLQAGLYGEGKRAVLLILQGMDASGKDGTIRHVLTGLNPMGVRVSSFKKPTAAELAQDYLWRIHACCPARGMIGVFNRSHYEDVLVVRINNLVPRQEWEKRYEQINDFERMLVENGTVIIKCFLHVSKEEQKKRLEERLRDPEKSWKFEPSDLEVRKQWDEYQQAYEVALSRCSTHHAPWHVIPADNKWFRNLVVSELLVQTMRALKCKTRQVQPEVLKMMVV